VSEPLGVTSDRLVVAVCSGRVADVLLRWRHTVAQLDKDDFLVVLDCAATPETDRIAADVAAAGGYVHVQGARRGLSAARNHVLAVHPDRRVLFLDDDAWLDADALDAIRGAFAAGAEVVGARLVPPRHRTAFPWFLTGGQVHLLGWHPAGALVKVWGACMGLDAAFAARHRLTFATGLGRTGHRLESGDDTEFVARMKRHGARETVLAQVEVVHDVHAERISLRYLTRRAYWQGRSEVRRGERRAGLAKEWGRFRAGGRGPRALGLALWYAGAVVTGIVHERLPAPGPQTRS